MNAYDGDIIDGWQDYYTYGGLPKILSIKGDDKKEILVSRDRISRRNGEIDLYYVTDFFKALWNDEII